MLEKLKDKLKVIYYGLRGLVVVIKVEEVLPLYDEDTYEVEPEILDKTIWAIQIKRSKRKSLHQKVLMKKNTDEIVKKLGEPRHEVDTIRILRAKLVGFKVRNEWIDLRDSIMKGEFYPVIRVPKPPEFEAMFSNKETLTKSVEMLYDEYNLLRAGVVALKTINNTEEELIEKFKKDMKDRENKVIERIKIK